MAQSFGIVEDKLREADFFLERLRASNPLSPDARFYFSAFVSAARSVTLAIQATMRDVGDFELWYRDVQDQLRADPLAPLFVEIRNDAVHKGLNALGQVPVEHLREYLSDQMYGGGRSHVLVLPNLQSGGSALVDGLQACTAYLGSLVGVVFECYDRFRCVVDPRWYFTSTNFEAMGKTFVDAVAEFGLPPKAASCFPGDQSDWRVLRSQQPRNQINDVFQKYIGREITDPDDPS